VASQRPEVVAQLSAEILGILRATLPDTSMKPAGMSIADALDGDLRPRDTDPSPKSFRRAAVVWLTSDWPMRIRPSVPHGGGWNHRAVECGPEASCTKSCRLSFDGSSAFHPSALQPWQTKSDTPISHRRNLQRRRASNSPSLGQVGRLRKPPERPRKNFLASGDQEGVYKDQSWRRAYTS
jgi:hypothetical protein